jgi:hypothetical protein
MLILSFYGENVKEKWGIKLKAFASNRGMRKFLMKK